MTSAASPYRPGKLPRAAAESLLQLFRHAALMSSPLELQHFQPTLAGPGLRVRVAKRRQDWAAERLNSTSRKPNDSRPSA